MSKRVVALCCAVTVLFLGYGITALAADAPACAAKQCPANMKCTMSGKVDVKTEKVDGKDAKVAYLTISDAKTDDGKACCAEAKGKTIKLVGAKAAEAEKLAGKQVEVKGACKAAGKEFDATSVTEKK